MGPKKNKVVVLYPTLININHNNLHGTTFPNGNVRILGMSIVSLSTDEMLVITIDMPEGTGERLGVGDLPIGAAFARNLTERF